VAIDTETVEMERHKAAALARLRGDRRDGL